MAEPVTDRWDIQALLKSGYGTLDEAVFLLLRIVDVPKATAWLRAIASERGAGGPSYRVTSLDDLTTRQKTALHVALTAPALDKLGVRKDVIHGFSREFFVGMAGDAAAAEGRSRRLGDLGTNDPANWAWGGGGASPDVLVMLYAAPGGLASYLAQTKADLRDAFEVMQELATTHRETSTGDRVEPFGFIDGISQPTIDWRGEREPRGDQELYGNVLCAGEFLLGYKNEYGIYEDRPLLQPDRDPRGLLRPAMDVPGVRDLGRNGSYLVFRQLEQDVEGFWRFARARDPENSGVSLAEAMVGRRLGTGAPLVNHSRRDVAGIGTSPEDVQRNGFTFDTDPSGLACPFGAHIRRANPRTADIPGGKQDLVSWGLRTLGFKHDGARADLVSSARFHRIVRRGRAYGDTRRTGAAASDPRPPRAGLHFICLNANIARQFEFIQNAWLMNPTFDGMSGEADPLLGNRIDWPAGHPTDGFTRPQSAGPCRRAGPLPQFITVRGGAYFFLPSVRALRFLTQ